MDKSADFFQFLPIVIRPILPIPNKPDQADPAPSFAGIPPGCVFTARCFRWYRCAQPPANGCDAFGIKEGRLLSGMSKSPCLT